MARKKWCVPKRAKEIFPGCIHVLYRTQYELATAFMRPQEFYDSSIPGFTGRWFEHAEFMDAYAKTRGHFTYHMDWSGFNVPGESFMEWYDKSVGSQTALSAAEAALFKAIGAASSKIDDKDWDAGKFYIVGTSEEFPGSFNHEVCHALYRLDKSYRKRMNAALAELPCYDELRKRLMQSGYKAKVVKDEAQAYLVGGDVAVFENSIGMKLPAEWRKFEAIRYAYKPVPGLGAYDTKPDKVKIRLSYAQVRDIVRKVYRAPGTEVDVYGMVMLTRPNPWKRLKEEEQGVVK